MDLFALIVTIYVLVGLLLAEGCRFRGVRGTGPTLSKGGYVVLVIGWLPTTIAIVFQKKPANDC